MWENSSLVDKPEYVKRMQNEVLFNVATALPVALVFAQLKCSFWALLRTAKYSDYSATSKKMPKRITRIAGPTKIDLRCQWRSSQWQQPLKLEYSSGPWIHELCKTRFAVKAFTKQLMSDPLACTGMHLSFIDRRPLHLPQP
jgi:hypothetical protein